MLGAQLVDGGPRQADAFLRWLGLPVCCGPGCEEMKPADLRYRYRWPYPQRVCTCW